MARFDNFTNLRALILERAGEDPDDTEGDFYDLASDAIAEAWRALWARWPWADLLASPPGAVLLADDITSLTLTVAAAGASVPGTLSAAPSVSLGDDYEIRPSGKNWFARITAQAGTAITLDAAPETVAAGTACAIYKIEYDLEDDFGLFVDGFWDRGGQGFVEILGHDRFQQLFPGPPEAARVPAAATLIGDKRVRFSEYPNTARVLEYPYTTEPDDPSGSGTFVLGAHVRPALYHLALSELHDAKFDRRLPVAEQKAERIIQRAIEYERRRREGQGNYAGKFRSSYAN